MAEAARMFSLRRLERADNVERQELLTSLAHTRALIQQAYRGFNSAADGLSLIQLWWWRTCFGRRASPWAAPRASPAA